MDVKSLYASILNQHKANRVSCRGLNKRCERWAIELVKPHFERENVSFDDWEVFEIPVWEDESEEFPCTGTICMVNRQTKQNVDLDFKFNGELFGFSQVKIEGSFGTTIEFDSLSSALESELSYYENNC